MAQVKTLKINSSGLPQEIDVTADDITFASFTVNGGPVLNANLDMNNGNISDVNDLSFTDPTTDGITNTNGTFAADDIMFDSHENVMEVGAAILFPVITDVADSVDALRIPALAGTPTATPTDGGEGYLVWDSTNDKLFAWTGTEWDDLSTVTAAERVCNSYTAAATLAAGDVVYISAADNVNKADVSSSGAASRPIGLALTAATATNPVDVCCNGIVSGLSGLTAGARYFADPAVAGGITSTVPVGAGNKLIQIGYAKSATELHLQIDYLGRRA